MRLAIAALVVAFASPAHADTAAKSEPKPDEIADVESREANLESKEPRKGFTFAGSIGGSITIGSEVGRGPATSFRLGHVATRKTIITFELVATNALHKAAAMSDTLTDNNVSLLAGAQRYTSASFWLRAAGGFTFLVKNATWPAQTGGEDPRGGVAGLVGGGLDIARWGYLVFGIEGYAITSVTSDGPKAHLALGLGLTYY